MAAGEYAIGADYMIEVSGLCCDIASVTVRSYDDDGWVLLTSQAEAAKDESRMEVGVASSVIGGASQIDFIIETTDWTGCRDQASDQASAMAMRTWTVQSGSGLSTESSNQRKVFYDGTNFWSAYFDGSNTVYEYSADGTTWSGSATQLFTATGIRKASIWYDSANYIVYAVGDTGSNSANIYIKRGVVNPSTPAITWGSDATRSVSANNMNSKNSFITKDVNGYLWILATNQTLTTGGGKWDLTLLRSQSTDSITSWYWRGNMLDTDASAATAKGSVLPAGSGSDVWCVYNYASTVAARKYTTSLGSEESIYTATGTFTFIDTAPASAVVDSSGYVHVVYGDATKSSSLEKPHIWYRYRDGTSWSSATQLDTSADSIGQQYPTISLETSTGALYAAWYQMDSYDIMGKKKTGASWSSVFTINSESSNTIQYLTSIYSVSGESHLCWQWTQNPGTSALVIIDKIPEFQDLAFPIVAVIAMFVVFSRRRASSKKDADGESPEAPDRR
jgi:hypothetical protein